MTMKMSNHPTFRKVGYGLVTILLLRMTTLYLTHSVQVRGPGGVVVSAAAANIMDPSPVKPLELTELSDWTQVHQQVNSVLSQLGHEIPKSDPSLQLALASYIRTGGGGGIRNNNNGKERSITTREVRELQRHLDLIQLQEESTTTEELEGQLEKRGYHLLKQTHTKRTESHLPYQESFYYLAYHPVHKKFIVNVHAPLVTTEVLQDIQTYTLTHNPLTGKRQDIQLKAPSQLMDTATAILQDIQPILEHLAMPSKYQIVLQGHGMGAGIATLLGMTLRSRVPYYDKNGIQVLAFAPPPVLEPKWAKAGGTTSFVTSIVHNDDWVPRMTGMVGETMQTVVQKVDQLLKQKETLPKDSKGRDKLTTQLLRSTEPKQEGQKNEEEEEGLLLDFDSNEWTKIYKDTVQQAIPVDGHTMVPGRIVYLNDDSHTATTLATNGAHGNLRVLPASKHLFSDHNPKAYRTALESVVAQERLRRTNWRSNSKTWFRSAAVIWGNITGAFLFVLFFTEGSSFLRNLWTKK